ncbi:MAG: type II secretory pathway pseudopilin PulG [Candidatus Endobugula sp.]|jgi:type II secretory pathway pseudopilin PulG
MDNYWPVIFIVCGIALAVGPVMMMQPSQRIRRLSALRQAAAQKSIRVRLSNVTLASGKTEVAVYSMPLPSTDAIRPAWVLLQQDYAHDVNFSQQWDWDNKKYTAPASQYAILRELLSSFDQSIIGFEASQSSVGIYWCEKTLTIDDIDTLLTRCKDALS